MTASNVVSFYSRGLTSRFGDARAGGRKHRGVDFSHSSTPGTRVPALLAGTVVGKLSPASWHGFGYQVTIRSIVNGVVEDISYAHGAAASPLAMGQKVSQGQTVITEGKTGWTAGSCVHVERKRNGFYVDPLPLIRSVVAGTAFTRPSTGIPFTAHDKWVQESLNRLGYTPRLAEDGRRGSATIAQIKRFQTAKKLRVDGIPGRATTAALKADLAKQAAKGDGLHWLTDWPWRGIQEMLAAEYGYKGKLDGKPGDGTWKAMQRFLKAKYGYAGQIDGKPGGGTISALARWLRARWRYVGNNVPGKVMRAAFARAEAANGRAYGK